jgi:hypothetical protein
MNYRNAKYCLDLVRVDCEIDHPAYGWIPFTCNPSDTEASFDVRKLYDKIVKDGQISLPTKEEIDEEASVIGRIIRNTKLEDEVDPQVTNPLRWADLSPEKQQEWADYRRSLLDLPEQEGWPHDIEWPIKPA